MKVMKEATFLAEDSFPQKKDPSKNWYKPTFLVDNREVAEGFNDQPCGLVNGDVVNLEFVVNLSTKKLTSVKVVQ